MPPPVTAPAATTPVARASLTSAVSTPTAAAVRIGGGLDSLLSVFFRNGTAADPNAGLIMGNGFTFTADKHRNHCVQRRQRRTLRQRRRRLQRRKRRCLSWFGNGGNGGAGIALLNNGAGGNGGAAGLIAGNGGNGGAGVQACGRRHRRQERIGRAVRQRR